MGDDLIQMTSIARLHDKLVLCAREGNVSRVHKDQLKKVLRTLHDGSDVALSIPLDGAFLMYMLQGGIVYVVLCAKSYPVSMARSYLEEIAKEFDAQHGSEAMQATRPYHFIKFESVIGRTKRNFVDSRAKANMRKVAADLSSIHSVMSKSLSDVLDRGQRLDDVTMRSESLLHDSKRYKAQAVALNRRMWLRKYGMFLIVAFLVLLVFVARWYFF